MAMLAGAWKTVVLRAMWTVEPSSRGFTGNKISSRPRVHPRDKNVAAFCPCTKNLCENMSAGATGGQKKELVKFQLVVRCSMWVLRSKIWILTRALDALTPKPSF